MDKTPVVPKLYLIPFILVTTLFALWGFANNVTDPLVAAFKDIFVINNAQSSWVQMAFYGGYATMAIPAALFIRKFSYKSGILLGLVLYATGAFLSVPAAAMASFNLFLVALYILTFGLAFLETTANPYILSMGDPKTATQRLNLAQAFNPIGSLSGMFIAGTVILGTINVEDFRNDVAGDYSEKFPTVATKEAPEVLPFLKAKPRERKNDETIQAYVDGIDSPVDNPVGNALVDYKEGTIATYQGMNHAEMQKKDLKIVSLPYTIIGFVLVGVIITFLVVKMPTTSEASNDHEIHFSATLGRLFKNPRYVGGVIAQTFYVGVQIMVWTYIIQYAETELGLDKATAQNHNILAVVIFLLSRFACTFFLKYISAGKLLLALAIAGGTCTLGAIYLQGMPGLYSLIAISACMSLMFPTIYGLALDGVGQDAKLGSAGLIFAIVGGAVMPRLQGGFMDMETFMGVSGTRGSFYLPFLCFVVIAIYGFACRKPRPQEAS
ncbi:MFS transporter [Rubritalea tangerina]|uniref:MFS transporter n=1 Tax=Rubritalea tangerina TaxID=430798 RepID=A0ABW4Z7I2_9BACT